MIRDETLNHFVCEKCGKWFLLDDGCYLSPRDRSDTSCHPFMDFVVYRAECEKEER